MSKSHGTPYNRQVSNNYSGTMSDMSVGVESGQWQESNRDWRALGLDPTLYSGNLFAQRKGYQMSGADLQAALVNRENADHAAQLEFDLSKKMFDETQSWQAQVEQMRAAGINPLFGVTGGSTTGGADAPAVSTGTTSNSGSAVSAASQQLGAGQIAVDAFRQAMSIPMIKEQVRGMQIENDRQQAMEQYYRNQIIADTERKQSDAKLATANAIVADMTKDDKISQSSIDTQAKRLGLDGQKFDNLCKEYQSRIMSIDSDYKQKFVDLDLRMMRATLEKNVQETKNLQQEAIKLAKECKILDKDIQYADEREFLAYMNVFNGYITAMSQRVSAGASLGMYLGPSASGYLGKSVELIEGAFGSALESVRHRWGGKGFYVSAGDEGHYPLIHPPYRGDEEEQLSIDELIEKLNNMPMWTYGLDNND